MRKVLAKTPQPSQLQQPLRLLTPFFELEWGWMIPPLISSDLIIAESSYHQLRPPTNYNGVEGLYTIFQRR